jgi:hypothetical protein
LHGALTELSIVQNLVEADVDSWRRSNGDDEFNPAQAGFVLLCRSEESKASEEKRS